MSYSFTSSETQTFTITHAKYIASKVATDLKRIQRFYNSPSDNDIQEYEAELTQFLKRGFLVDITYGFKKDGKWIEPTLRYTAKDLAGSSGPDDDPGRIQPGANVTGAIFVSFLTWNSAYADLTDSQRAEFHKDLPFSRSAGNAPGMTGYLTSDKTYSSGGKSVERSILKNS